MGGNKKSRRKRRHDSSSDSSESSQEHTKKKKRKKKCDNTSSSSDSSSSDSESYKKRKRHRQEKKEKKKLKKLKKKLKKLERRRSGSSTRVSESEPNVASLSTAGAKKAMVPMTKAEWEKQQNEIRREFDPTTGRSRLVRGSGEIIEEIVSKERQREINKKATIGDGIFYQKQTGLL